MSEAEKLLPQRISDDDKRQTHKRDVALMIFISFISSVGFSIVLPSLAPFIAQLHGPDTSLVGWAIAANSAGSMFSSPFLGYWSDRRTAREVLAFGLIIGIIGNLTYSLSLNIWMLFAGRFLVGVFSGTGSTSSAYLSYATREEHRTLIYTINSGMGVIGFILGPAFAAVATLKIFQFDVVIRGQLIFHVSETTSPGFISCILMLVALLMCIFFFREVPRIRKTPGATSSKVVNTVEDEVAKKPLTRSALLSHLEEHNISLTPLLIIIFYNFTFTVCFTAMETIGTPYTTTYFLWNVQQNSIMWTSFAGVAIVSLIILQISISCWMQLMHYERIWLAVAQALLAFGTGLCVEDSWVKPRVWVLLLGIGIATLGYGYTAVLNVSLFSKILEGVDQGTWMGYFNSAGGAARIVAPVLSGYAFQYTGGKWVFLPCTVFTIISLILNLVYWKQLVAPGREIEAAAARANDAEAIHSPKSP